jgi:L-amino acid N-acyltransferase YncA
MKWAYEAEGVREFVATISPGNIASRRLAEGFGFEQVGSHIDEEDGLEYIYSSVVFWTVSSGIIPSDLTS